MEKQTSILFDDFPSTPTLAQLGLSSRAMAHIETPPFYSMNRPFSKPKQHTTEADELMQTEVLGEDEEADAVSFYRHSLSSSSVSIPTHHLPRTSMSSQLTPQSTNTPLGINDIESNTENTPITTFHNYDRVGSHGRGSLMDMPSSAQFNHVSKQMQEYRPSISDSEGYND